MDRRDACPTLLRCAARAGDRIPNHQHLADIFEREEARQFSIGIRHGQCRGVALLHEGERVLERRVGVDDWKIGVHHRSHGRFGAGFPQRGFGPAGDLERVRGVFHYWSAGAMVTLPILNRNQGAIAAAQADRTVAAAQVDAARLTAQAEVAAARARDRNARRALDAYGAEAIGLARQNLDIVRQTYELGRGTLLDVLNEQRRYLDLERAYTDVLREAFEARQTLKEALGETR